MLDWISLLPFIAIVFAVGLSGAVFMPGEWYKTLDKPPWTPPAWTVLYVLIAIAGWMVWSRDGFGAALGAWALNLVFNAAWSWLMFGRQQIGAALADAGAMLVTILAFIWLAYPISETAALLFVPYLGWVAFALMLNAEILRRNPQAA